MPTFDELQDFNDKLIRKGLQGSVFAKLYEDGDAEIVSLRDTSGLLAIPTGYEAIGRLTKDQGVNWTRDVATSDTTSLGASSPTRRDITSDVTGLQFTAQETKALTMGMYEGLDLSAVTYDADGNYSYDKPDRPASLYYRIFVLFKDGEGADAHYFAKWLPRAQVTDRGEESWREEQEIQRALTLTAFVDAAVGTSVRSLGAGPATDLTAMGFTAGA